MIGEAPTAPPLDADVDAESHAKRRQVLLRQHDYFRYMYEQEVERATKIVAGGRVYVAILGVILGSLFLQVIPFAKIARLVQAPATLPAAARMLAWALTASSILTLALAVIFSLLVFRVWNYERLCDPRRRLHETLAMSDEAEVLSKSLADFAVATERNFLVNNRRATCLSLALVFLFLAVLFTLVAASYLNVTL